jgi:hypothetical protein
MEPAHPKMGYLVSEAAQRSAGILQKKRIAASQLLSKSDPSTK